jgi:hypothetical protein
MYDTLYDYVRKVFLSWWIVVPVVVGGIRLIEWFFREGKPFSFLSSKVRWRIALLGLVIAQFMAYRDALDERDTARTARASAEKTTTALKERVTGIENLLREKDLRIQELAGAAATRKPGDSTAGTDRKSTTQIPEPPIMTGLRFTQKRVASDDIHAPYGLEVVIQTEAVIQPVRILVVCDGEIKDGRVSTGGGAATNVLFGVQSDRPNIFSLSWDIPALTPATPIALTLMSKQPIRVTQIKRFD